MTVTVYQKSVHCKIMQKKMKKRNIIFNFTLF